MKLTHGKGNLIQLIPAPDWYAIYTDRERDENIDGPYDLEPLVGWALYENGDVEPLVTAASEVFNPWEMPFREDWSTGYEDVIHETELRDPVRLAELDRRMRGVLAMARGEKERM